MLEKNNTRPGVYMFHGAVLRSLNTPHLQGQISVTCPSLQLSEIFHLTCRRPEWSLVRLHPARIIPGFPRSLRCRRDYCLPAGECIEFGVEQTFSRRPHRFLWVHCSTVCGLLTDTDDLRRATLQATPVVPHISGVLHSKGKRQRTDYC